MTTLATQVLTLSDWAKRVDPDGKVDAVVELLNETNEILMDALWKEGNLPTGHKTTIRTGLPSVAWRKLNYGVPPSKSRTAQVTDACGMLEAYAEIDKKLADLNGNTTAFRLSEDQAFLEAMNQEMASMFFYGDTSQDPEKILGLAPRYSDPSAENGENLLDGGGTGSDNTSVWLIVWGANTVHGIFPKASKAGISHEDLGEVTLEDAAGGKYQGYRTHYKWESGLTLKDWRYAVRICNIDVSDLATFGAGTDNSAALIRLLIQAYNKIPHLGMGRPVIYCNKTVKTWLDIMAGEKSNVLLNISEYAGRPVTNFWGVPVRRCDAILDTEDAVSFS